MTDKQSEKVKVSQTAMQRRAEHMKKLREQARENRKAKGIQTDPGVTFADLPQEVRDDHFYNLEQNHKSRYNKSRGGRRGGSPTIPTFDETERGEAVSVKVR